MPDDLVARYLPQLSVLNARGPVLDLACGSGKNGLYLARQGLTVTLADINAEVLAEIHNTSVAEQLAVTLWLVDFENPENPPPARQFSAIIVYRYLHRPLSDWIKQSLLPGGLIIYSTFTHHQAAIGRPQRPAFLLQDNELLEIFNGWEVLHHWQGFTPAPTAAMAAIVARKPL